MIGRNEGVIPMQIKYKIEFRLFEGGIIHKETVYGGSEKEAIDKLSKRYNTKLIDIEIEKYYNEKTLKGFS